MNVKIVYDPDGEYICFVSGVRNIIGYGESEQDSLRDFLCQCEGNPLFNRKIISDLLLKLQ